MLSSCINDFKYCKNCTMMYHISKLVIKRYQTTAKYKIFRIAVCKMSLKLQIIYINRGAARFSELGEGGQCKFFQYIFLM